MKTTPEFNAAFARLEVAVHALTLAVPSIDDYFEREALRLLVDEAEHASLLLGAIVEPARGTTPDHRWDLKRAIADTPSKTAGLADA